MASSIVTSLCPSMGAGFTGITRLRGTNRVVHLEQGLFIMGPRRAKRPLSSKLVTGRLLSPSCMSVRATLECCNLVPRTMCAIRSVAFGATGRCGAPVNGFYCCRVSEPACPVKVARVGRRGGICVVTAPRGTLYSLVTGLPNVGLECGGRTLRFLRRGLEFSVSEFCRLGPGVFRRCTGVKGGTASVHAVLGLLRRR